MLYKSQAVREVAAGVPPARAAARGLPLLDGEPLLVDGVLLGGARLLRTTTGLQLNAIYQV